MTSHQQLTQRTDEAFRIFERLGGQLIRSFGPRNVLIVGPVVGLLAETLWERGVQAYCECPDQAAIELVRMDVKGFCTIGNGSAPSLDYDVVVAVSIATQAAGELEQAQIDYLKSRSRSVLFIEIEGEQDGEFTASPLLDRIEHLQAAGLIPAPSFDVTYPGIRVLLTTQEGEALSPRHMADIVRMRRLAESLQHAQGRTESAQRHALGVEHNLKAEQDRVESLKVEALQAQAQLKEAIVHVNATRSAMAQTQADAYRKAQEMQAQVQAQMQAAREQAEASARELAAAHAALASASHPEEIARLNDHILRLHNELAGVYGSSCWRVTLPIRAIGKHAPIVTKAARVTVKAVYWTVTLQLPRRLREWTAYQRSKRSK